MKGLVLKSILLIGSLVSVLGPTSISSAVIQNQAKLSKHPVLLVVSFSGFRYDYLDKIEPLAFNSLKAEGSSVPFMKPQFPSNTLPNHHSIVTGLYPESHGVVDDVFYDPDYDKELNSEDTGFWNYSPEVQPIWIRNEEEKDERYSGCYMWPGSSQGYGENNDLLPTYLVRKPDNTVPWENRVDKVISWITDEEKPANLVFLYFDQPATTGQEYGTDTIEIITEINTIDGMTGVLVQKLKDAGIYEEINLIILSDHGMENVKQENVIDISNKISDSSTYDRYGSSPLIYIQPKSPLFKEKIYSELKAEAETKNFSVFKKEEMTNLHFTNNRRITDLIVLADPGYGFEDLNFNAEGNRGVQGYENRHQNMAALFIARGPLFKQGFEATSIENVDLVPLIAHVMNLKVIVNNGTLDVISSLLEDFETSTPPVQTTTNQGTTCAPGDTACTTTEKPSDPTTTTTESSSSTTTEPTTPVPKHPKLLVVSFSGFRYDYSTLSDTIYLNALKAEGSSVPFMRPQFPTNTLPNHQSIVTGLYPESHGVVDDSFFDPYHREELNGIDDSPEFWNYSPQVQPIWLRNEQEQDGRYSGCYMWPGSSHGYGENKDQIPTYSGPKPDESVPWEDRVDTVISWITNEQKPANLVFLYFNQPATAGHEYGTDEIENIAEIGRSDERTGVLIQKLQDAGIYDEINLIILSDHGMTTVREENVIDISNVISDPNSYTRYGSTPVFHIQPTTSFDLDKIYSELKAEADSKKFSVYKKQEMADLHFTNNRRITDLIVVADPGYGFEDMTFNNEGIRGVQGYDNRDQNMAALFIARGPLFKKRFVAETFIENIDVFPLIAHVMNFTSGVASNGTLDVISTLLVESPTTPPTTPLVSETTTPEPTTCSPESENCTITTTPTGPGGTDPESTTVDLFGAGSTSLSHFGLLASVLCLTLTYFVQFSH